MAVNKKKLYPSDQRQVQPFLFDNLCTKIIAYDEEKYKCKKAELGILRQRSN